MVFKHTPVLFLYFHFMVLYVFPVHFTNNLIHETTTLKRVSTLIQCFQDHVSDINQRHISHLTWFHINKCQAQTGETLPFFI